MARRPTTGPTDAELEILQVLWQRGPSTVREVNAQLSRRRPTGQTTTLKLMQIMVDKGLLLRDESVRPQLFRPAADKATTQRTLVRDLLHRAFDGSAAQLVVQALSSKRASARELQEIRRLLSDMERNP